MSREIHFIFETFCPWQKLGNQELVRNADQLWWFGHTYKHHQPHSMSHRQLQTSMELNRQFAKVSSLLLHSISTILYIEYRKSRHSEDYIGGIGCVHTGRLLVWESGSHVAQTKTVVAGGW